MIRTLLATTAVAAVLALPVIAQDASSSMESSSMMDSSMSSMESSAMDSSAMMSSQMTDASSMDSSMMSSATDTTTTAVQPRTPVEILSGYNRVATDALASKIIGQPVYDGPGKDANNLGNIKDLVLGANGDVAAVVVGVGGFLGLGEKQVAVDFTALKLVAAEDNTKRYVLETTKEDLTNAPDFKTVDESSAPASGAVPEAAPSSSAAQ